MKTISASNGSLVFLLVLLQSALCTGQDTGTDTKLVPENVAQAAGGETNPPVVLTYGMARELVIQELGNPAFESIVRSLQRAKVIYSDNTRLVFDRDSLVLVETVIPAKMDSEGFAIAEAAGKELRIDSRLLAAQPQLPEPAEEHRLIRDQAFFFAPGMPATMNAGIPFSPVSGCLFGPAAGRLPACQQNVFQHSTAGDPFSRLLFSIKRDLCHVCP